jgi:hypothetical protein
VAFGGHACASLWVVKQVEGIPLRRSLGKLWPSLFACALMGLAVLATRAALGHGPALPAALRLAIEVLAGGVSYVVAVLLVARDVSQELYTKLRLALRPRAYT